MQMLDQVTSFFAHLPLDWVIIGLVFAVIAALSLKAGSARAATLILSLPLALTLFIQIQSAALIGALVTKLQAQPLWYALFFIGLVILGYIFVHRITSSYSTLGGVVEGALSGLAGTALLMVVWQSIPALDVLWHFGPWITAAFSEAYRFWWTITSLILIAFARS